MLSRMEVKRKASLMLYDVIALPFLALEAKPRKEIFSFHALNFGRVEKKKPNHTTPPK